MGYTPVSQRNKKSSSGYVPVSQRQTQANREVYKLADGSVVTKQQLNHFNRTGELYADRTPQSPLGFKQAAGQLFNKVTNAATSAGQMLLSGGAAIGATFLQPLLKTQDKIALNDPVSRGLYGEGGITTIPGLYQEGKAATSNYGPIQSTLIGAVASLAPVLDITGAGGEKAVVSSLAKASKFDDAANILRKMGIADDLVEDYAPMFVKMKTVREVQDGLRALENVLQNTKPKYTPVAARGGSNPGKASQPATQLTPGQSSRFPAKTPGQIQTSPTTSKSYAGTVASPTAPVKVYRAVEIGAPANKNYQFFTDSAEQAERYRQVIKPIYGETRIVERDISGRTFFETTKKNYLDDIESPAIKANYDGIKFKDGDTTSYALFKNTNYIKETDGKFAGRFANPEPKARTFNQPDNALTIGEDMYAANRSRPPKNPLKESASGFGRSIKSAADALLTPISTRLKNINPILKQQLRKFEFNSATARKKDIHAVSGWVKKTKKMSRDDYADLDLALKNSDTRKINQLIRKYGLEKEYRILRKILDEAHERATKVGYDVGYTKDYHPRKVSDAKGYLEHLEKGDSWKSIQEAIERKEAKLGRQLSLEERAYVANSMLRGYPTSQISLSTPGALKSRSSDIVTAETNAFYADSNSALLDYLDNVNDAIEGRRFFGKGPKGDALANSMDSIGAYVDDLVRQGLIKRSQEQEIRELLLARFNPGRMGGILATIKNTAYIDVMGNFTSALTQLQDFGFSFAKQGFWNTLKSILSEKDITIESLGLQKHIAQFDDSSTLAKAVDKVFTATGLSRLDRLAKETYINAALRKARGEAKNPSLGFLKKMDEMFGREADDVIRTLKEGEIDENVRLLMFNDILDIAPIALSEFPEKYLKMGNGKILYMLKSYTIKQIDVYRNDVFQLMKTDPKQAAINFTRLTGALLAMGIVADEAKEFVTGKENVDLDDKVVNNILKMMGFNRYTIDNIGKEGLSGTIENLIMPPTRLADNLIKGNDQVVRSVPVIGELYYWWFGGGSDDKTTRKTKAKGPIRKQ